MRRFMNKLVETFTPARKHCVTRRSDRRCVPRLEALEDRLVLSPYTLQQAQAAISAEYTALGGSKGILGAATTGVTAFNGGYDEQFTNGAIFASLSTGSHYLDGAIATEYFHTAGETGPNGQSVQAILGLPTQNQGSDPGVAGAQLATFQGGDIFWSAATGAHVVYGAIATEYNTTASEKGGNGVIVQKTLGLPTADQGNVPGVAGAQLVPFQGGDIYWSAATGAHVVYGDIGSKYSSLGGPKGSLGLPTADEQSLVNGGRVSYFQNGQIDYSSATGAHVLSGAISQEYLLTASEKGSNGMIVQDILGLPTQDQGNDPGVAGAQLAPFQGGNIYWSSATGAHVVYGAILQEYLHTASETDANGNNVQKVLGLPTYDEQNVLWDNSARVSIFQGGDIFWSSATGAHVVYGAILQEYLNAFTETGGNEQGVLQILGMPTSDEQNVSGVKGARMNSFQGGDIFWSSATGAHVVYGAIGSEYLNNLGGPGGAYGLPTADEQAMPNGGREQFFQHGKVYWTGPTGVVAVPAVTSMTFTDNNVTFSGSTPVGGWVSLTVYADGSYDFSGHLHDSGFPSYNDTLVLGILSPSGVLYTFTHTGHMNGTVESGSRNDDWNVSGSMPQIAANWTDLEGATGPYWKLSTSTDWNSVVNQFEQALQTTITVVQVIAAAF